MRIIIDTEAQYLPAFREMAKALKATISEVGNEANYSAQELEAAGILELGEIKQGTSLTEMLAGFSEYPLKYEDVESLRRAAWRRND